MKPLPLSKFGPKRLIFGKKALFRVLRSGSIDGFPGLFLAFRETPRRRQGFLKQIFDLRKPGK
jgi:hypothetical protein